VGEPAAALVRAGCAGPLAGLVFTGDASAQVQAAMSLLAASWASAEGAVAVAQTIGSRKLQHGAASALALVILIAMSPVGQPELGCADFGALFGEEFASHIGARPNPDGGAESAVDGLGCTPSSCSAGNSGVSGHAHRPRSEFDQGVRVDPCVRADQGRGSTKACAPAKV